MRFSIVGIYERVQFSAVGLVEYPLIKRRRKFGRTQWMSVYIRGLNSEYFNGSDSAYFKGLVSAKLWFPDRELSLSLSLFLFDADYIFPLLCVRRYE